MFENGLLLKASRLVASSALVMACLADASTIAFAAQDGDGATEVFVAFDSSGGSDQPSDDASDDDKSGERDGSQRGRDSLVDESSSSSEKTDKNADGHTGKNAGHNNATGDSDERQTGGANAADRVLATTSKPISGLPQTGDVVLPVCIAWVVASGAVLVASILLRRKRGGEK